MSITLLIIVFTVVISVLSFNNREMFGKLQFNAYQVVQRNEYYRLISHAFVHANWWHLLVNMFVLYFFGGTVEYRLEELTYQGLIKHPQLVYLLFYLLAVVFASTVGLAKHKGDIWYNAVGASGAVSAVLFFSIFFDPWRMMIVYFIPVPGIVFAVLYVVYSHYQAKRGGDNVAHDAHLLGAIFGFIFPLFLSLDLYKFFLSGLLGL